MATFPKITDSEMNYFQFKARQLLLLKKEDEEWQEYYLKQTDPRCTACSAEKKDATKESKTVGIQVSSKKPFVGLGNKSVQFEHQDNRFPQALHNIAIKLENIDLALSKMYDASKKTEMDEAKPLHINESLNAEALKSLAEQRKYLIQKSLKASLQKVPNLSPRKPKQIPVRNSGYFLPHDLQQKRAVARRAYLASLQTTKIKPKVTENVKCDSKKNVPSSKTKKDLSRTSIKSRKKTADKFNSVKCESKKEKTEESTLVEAVGSDEQKDENIEYAVDGILDDLLREAVVDLNGIKQRSRGKQLLSSHSEIVTEDREQSIPQDLVKSQVATIPKMLADNSDGIRKIKLFLDSPKKSQQKSENANKAYVVHHRNVFHEDSEQILKESDVEKPFSSIIQPNTSYEIKNPPKFICGVSQILSVHPNKVKEIKLHKDRFWKYLKDISRTIKGNFNPWIFCNMIAESILDDCIKDIAEELSDVPSILIKELYDKEFVQHVEIHSRK